MSWVDSYVGLPFGDGPGEVTCWSLVRRVYAEQLGIALDAHGDASAAYICADARLRQGSGDEIELARALATIQREMTRGQGARCWLHVGQPRVFDVVLMRTGGSASIRHVGVMADAASVLHVEPGGSAVVEPVSGFRVRQRIAGYRRHVA